MHEVDNEMAIVEAVLKLTISKIQNKPPMCVNRHTGGWKWSGSKVTPRLCAGKSEKLSRIFLI